jgi:hypothetical protein
MPPLASIMLLLLLAPLLHETPAHVIDSRQHAPAQVEQQWCILLETRCINMAWLASKHPSLTNTTTHHHHYPPPPVSKLAASPPPTVPSPPPPHTLTS